MSIDTIDLIQCNRTSTVKLLSTRLSIILLQNPAVSFQLLSYFSSWQQLTLIMLCFLKFSSFGMGLPFSWFSFNPCGPFSVSFVGSFCACHLILLLMVVFCLGLFLFCALFLGHFIYCAARVVSLIQQSDRSFLF